MSESTKKHIVIHTEPLDPTAIEWLDERVNRIECNSDDPSFRAHLASAHGLIVRTYTQVNRELLSHAPRLRVVGRAGVGIDNIDVALCKEKNIPVVYTPDANTEAVVEYVFTHLLNLSQPGPTIDAPLSLDAWQEQRSASVVPWELSERTIGIFGLGRIGKRIAETARAFRMRAIFHDLLVFPREASHGAEAVDAATLLRDSDIVTMHVDGRSQNRNLIGRKSFSHMKPDAIFINTSRGFVVDPEAAAAYFKANPDARGILDVHEPEPFDAAYPLLNRPNVTLTPHIAGRSRRALARMSEVVYDVYRVLSGERAKYPAW